MNEETRLLYRLRLGDTTAVEKIMDKYSPYVVTVIMNRLGAYADMSDAEELASNVFFSLWVNRRSIRTENLRGWLAAAARNEACSFLRKKRVETVDIDDCILIAADDTQKRCEDIERSELLTRTLGELDEQSREAMVRFYFFGQSLNAISEEMALNLSTVKSKLHRGKAKLKDKLISGGYGYVD